MNSQKITRHRLVTLDDSQSAVLQLPADCHGSCEAWPLGSGPASGQHHAAVATLVDGPPSLRCCSEEQRWGRASRPYGCAICRQCVFSKNLLAGSFLEAQRMQQKQPAEIAAAKDAVFATTGRRKYQWRLLVLKSCDWHRLTTCQS